MLRFKWFCTILLLVQVNFSFAQTPQIGTITVGGDPDKWYPVTFVDDGWDHEVVSELEITRFSVHMDAAWKGSMVAQIKFHNVAWGSSSAFIDVDLKNYRQTYPDYAFPTGDFIAGWQDGSWGDNLRRIIIWLKGSTTYNFKSNVTVSPTVYLDPSTLTAYGAPFSYKTAVEPYVNIYGRNEQTAFYNLDRPNYFRGNVGIGVSNPTNLLHLEKDQNAPTSIVIKNPNAGSAAEASVALYSDMGSSSLFHTNSSRTDGLANLAGVYTNASQGFSVVNNVGVRQFNVQQNGHVGIGTTNPGIFMLAVNGDLAAKKIRITQSGWPDYVFEPDYPLQSLDYLESYIRSHKHLPGIITASNVEKEGIDLGDNQAGLVKKIEELTLYIIQMDKSLKEQQQQIQQLQKRLRK